MGHFNTRENADAERSTGSGGEYLQPGRHTLMIEGCKFIPRTASGRKAYVVEFSVIDSAGQVPGQDAPHSEGDSVVWINIVPKFPGGEGVWETDNLQFAASVMGLDPKQDLEKIKSMQAEGEIDKALEGSVSTGAFDRIAVRCVARERTTRNGATITEYHFSPYERGQIMTEDKLAPF